MSLGPVAGEGEGALGVASRVGLPRHRRHHPRRPRRAGALPHAGTFNNNVLTMAAGVAGLTEIFTPATADALFARDEALRARLNAEARGAAMRWTGLGSLMTVHFLRGPVRSPAGAAFGSQALRDLFFFDMLQNRLYLARRGMIALSLQIGERECDALCTAVGDFLDVRARCLAEA